MAKQPGELEADDLREVALVVDGGAEVVDGAAPQPELDSELDQQREIRERQRLEHGDGRAGILRAADGLREPVRRQALVRERLAPFEHPLAVLAGRQPD